ncbi:MAG TPA: RnfH family protein [Casimicrobiaceae bacterium]|nr:RnfH family protein [Casimicrobiaceae bacterium]
MKTITVTVVAAWPARATEVRLELGAGATVADALAAAPEISCTASAPVGIYGMRVARDTALADHDRIEVYRALPIDPKDARRRRVKRG